MGVLTVEVSLDVIAALDAFVKFKDVTKGAGEQKSTLAREFGISRETLCQYLKLPPTP